MTVLDDSHNPDRPNRLKAFAQYLSEIFSTIHWNFFRIHLICHTLIPLAISGPFYALRRFAPGGRGSYIDALLLCYSAMTTTGLSPINISTLHPSQQAILLILSIIGDITVVSLIMVLVRKHYFRKHCQGLLDQHEMRRSKTRDAEATNRQENARELPTARTVTPKTALRSRRVSATRISAPVAVGQLRAAIDDGLETRLTRFDSPMEMDDTGDALGNAQSHIAFGGHRDIGRGLRRRATIRQVTLGRPSLSLNRQPTHAIPKPDADHRSGMGGFDVTTQIARRLAQLLPHRQMHQGPVLLTRDLPASSANSTFSGSDDSSFSFDDVKRTVAKWLPEGMEHLLIGRNGRFYTEELDDEELEVIGGVEYRALRFLSYFVSAYIVLCQLIPFAACAIYIAANKDFAPNQAQSSVQEASVNPYWAMFYLASTAFSGTGLSLIDQSVIPFASSYVVVYAIIVAMLIGNHAMPMMLRFCIWVCSKIAWTSDARSTLNFLLDHPRRCFLYLFPAVQTWYLVLVLIGFIIIEMIGYLALNIGLPVLEDYESGCQKFTLGLFQSLGVRASGLTIIPVANLAPATLLLYVVLMYVAIYPIALSVRSTNVYEEQSLGVFEPEEGNDEPVTAQHKEGVFGTYLMWHLRRQISFDAWPLALAIFVICIFERSRILSTEDGSWFTLFRVIFECTSAYALVGLSLGTPNANYSFVGEFGVGAKIVVGPFGITVY